MLDLLSPTRSGDQVVHQRVGIVDADPLYRWFVTEALSARGIDGLEFATVAEAARFAQGHPAADLLLVDHQTLIDEYASHPPDLRALAGGSCVLLATPEPGGALPQLGVVVVEKPAGLETLMGLVEGRLHRTS
jgi:hypothetical protein